MSSDERIKEWYRSLPDEVRQSIDEQIEKMRELDGEVVGHEDQVKQKKGDLTRMVKDLASKVERLLKDPSDLSITLKHLLEGKVSEDTIENALPDNLKKKTKPKSLPTVGDPIIGSPMRLAQSTDGRTQMTDSEENKKDEYGKGVVPMPREIDLSKEQQPRSKSYRIVMSRRLFSGLGNTMTQMARGGSNDKHYVIEHNAESKELLVYETEKNEQRNALGDDER